MLKAIVLGNFLPIIYLNLLMGKILLETVMFKVTKLP
jgi:hypothetical protein